MADIQIKAKLKVISSKVIDHILEISTKHMKDLTKSTFQLPKKLKIFLLNNIINLQ